MHDILFVTVSDLSGSSGHNVATKEMVAAFARHDSLAVSVLCPAPLGNLPEKVRKHVSEIHYLTPQHDQSIPTHLRTQASALAKAGNLLATEEFDLVVVRHAHVMLAPTVLSRVFSTPYVLLARGLAHEKMRFRPVLERIFATNVRHAEDVYCAHGEIVKRASAIRPYAKSAPVLFSNAVDPDEFRPESAEDLRAELSLPDTAFVVGFVGSLKNRHRIEDLVRAVAELPEDVHLLIVGDGPERDSLEGRVSDLGIDDRVVFTGVVDHDTISTYVSACDVAYGVKDPANPSNPIKVYEYLACETPVITSQSAEFEFVADRDAGAITDEITPDAIATAIRELRSRSTAERRQMGERGRAYVVKNHTWDRLVELVVERNLTPVSAKQ